MAKRFTATEKWDDPWFCDLSKNDKLFWLYLLDKCDQAGIWKVNLPLVRFYFGAEYAPTPATFNGRIQVLSPEKWHIPKFLEFQYKELLPTNNAHLSVLSLLRKEGLREPLTSPSQGDQDKDKEKEQVKERGEEWRGAEKQKDFDLFWQNYPKRRSKGAALKAWRKLNPTKELVGLIVRALEQAKTSPDWVKEGGQYIPNPATWINAMGWEDETVPNSSYQREVVG